MNLQKRDCSISIEIKPLGAMLLEVVFDFGGDIVEYTPSTAMADEQFGEFVSALYSLYHDETDYHFDGHNEWKRRRIHSDENHRILSLTATVNWDLEGSCIDIEMTKKYDADEIIFRISSDYGKTWETRHVDGRDLCYATAKACTKALKQFGFYGYRFSTESKPIPIYQLLFLKAYGLGSMEARELISVDPSMGCCRTDFEKEMELLLFDM